MKRRVRMIEYIKLRLMRNIIAARNRANMKPTMKMDDPIANFN
jgi:hypothetical protein